MKIKCFNWIHPCSSSSNSFSIHSPYSLPSSCDLFLYPLSPLSSTVCVWMQTVQWDVGSLSRATSGENHLATPQQSSLVNSSTKGETALATLPNMLEFLPALSSAWSYSHCHVQTKLHVSAIFHHFFQSFQPPIMIWFLSIRRKESHTDKQFRLNNSIVSYSWCFGQLWVSALIAIY